MCILRSLLRGIEMKQQKLNKKSTKTYDKFERRQDLVILLILVIALLLVWFGCLQ